MNKCRMMTRIALQPLSASWHLQYHLPSLLIAINNMPKALFYKIGSSFLGFVPHSDYLGISADAVTSMHWQSLPFLFPDPTINPILKSIDTNMAQNTAMNWNQLQMLPCRRKLQAMFTCVQQNVIQDC